jgi:hypothetical protein
MSDFLAGFLAGIACAFPFVFAIMYLLYQFPISYFVSKQFHRAWGCALSWRMYFLGKED